MSDQIKHWRERLDAHKGFYDGLVYHMGSDAIRAAMEQQIHDQAALINRQADMIAKLTKQIEGIEK